MKSIFKLVAAFILSIFKRQTAPAPAQTVKHEYTPQKPLEGAERVHAVITRKVDALEVARQYVPQSERIKRIVIKHKNREVLVTKGKQIDIDNYTSVFRVVAKTFMDDEIILHVKETSG